MDEDFAFMLIMAFWALLAFAVYQRFWVIRRLRRQLARSADAAIGSVDPAAARQPAGPVQVEPGELRRIQQRLQVLERIAVDKENALAREIEELRDAG